MLAPAAPAAPSPSSQPPPQYLQVQQHSKAQRQRQGPPQERGRKLLTLNRNPAGLCTQTGGRDLRCSHHGQTGAAAPAPDPERTHSGGPEVVAAHPRLKMLVFRRTQQPRRHSGRGGRAPLRAFSLPACFAMMPAAQRPCCSQLCSGWTRGECCWHPSSLVAVQSQAWYAVT